MVSKKKIPLAQHIEKRHCISGNEFRPTDGGINEIHGWHSLCIPTEATVNKANVLATGPWGRQTNLVQGSWKPIAFPGRP